MKKIGVAKIIGKIKEKSKRGKTRREEKEKAEKSKEEATKLVPE